jgi:2-keto-3-deoxy-6-phosphogluconate aldolase
MDPISLCLWLFLRILQVTAPILKSMLGVSPLAVMNIMPSGGVSPDNVDEWLDAGAAIVGMGSNLAGSDINYPTGSPAYDKAKAAWDATGRASAKLVFDRIAKRYC